MDARITLSPKTRCQISTEHKILQWMIENENRLTNTNITQLARSMVLSGPTQGCQIQTLRVYINRMVDKQLIYRHGGKRRAQFRINYLHKDVPPDIIDRAPKSVQLEVKRTIKGVTEGKYLDDVGCIVTPPKPEAPKEEDQSTPAEEVSDTPTETNTELAVPVKVTKDGKTLNITININLTI